MLIHEALSVGDSGFVQQCRRRIHELCARGSTVLIVSHNMEAIREMCGRVLWLHEGIVYRDGEPAEVIEEYLVYQRELLQKTLAQRFGRQLQAKQFTTELVLEELECLDGQGVAKFVFRVGESLSLRARLSSTRAWKDVTARVSLVRVDGVAVVDARHTAIALERGRATLRLDFGACWLGRYPYLLCWQLLDAAGSLLAEQQLVLIFDDDDSAHVYRAGYHQPLLWRQSPRSAVLTEESAFPS